MANGSNAFRFRFESASSSGGFPATVEVDAGGVRDNYSLNGAPGDIFNANPGSFSVDVPFSELDRVDLTQVTGFTFDGFQIPPDAGFRLTSISTIPEPSTFSLVLFSGFVISWRRRLRSGT